MQRILAKVAAPLFVLGDDMPDNDDADAELAKRRYLEWSDYGLLLPGSLASLQCSTTTSLPFLLTGGHLGSVNM